MFITVNYGLTEKQEIELAQRRQWIDLTIPENASKVIIAVALPMVDVHMSWRCAQDGGPSLKMHWFDEFSCGAQKGMPFIAFMNRSGILRSAFGTDDLWDDTRVKIQMNQAACTYDVTFTIAWHGAQQPLRFYADFAGDWQDSLAAWREAVVPKMPEIPKACLDPVYCTWYAIHAAITEDWVETMVPEMLKLGMKTLILDDGWCYDERKRVSPETLIDWYAPVGDWQVSEKKFPAFREHVSRMKSLGVNYMLWVAPHLIGARSRVYAEHPEWYSIKPNDGYGRLRIENPEARAFYQKRLCELLIANGLNGLKIDFLDVVDPDIEHPTGVVTGEFIRGLSEVLRKECPACMIEFRQGYDTPAMLPYATQFRAGDVPFDWHLNFRRMIDIRLSIGNLAPVHADPAYWAPEETSENIARHMMVMMMGVPMLSMDLTALTERERAIIRFWLKFYEEKKELINHGNWHFVYHCETVSAAIVENDAEKMVIVNLPGEEEMLSALSGKLSVLNISDRPITLPGADVYAGDGTHLTGNVIPVAGLGRA